MNLKLKADLEKAYAFLSERETYKQNIEWRNNQLKESYAKLHYTLHDYRVAITPQKQQGALYYIALLFLWPFVLWYHILFRKSIDKKELEKDLACQEKYDNFIKAERANIDKLNAELRVLQAKKANLERHKDCLSFITYDGYHQKSSVEYMHALVAKGQCNTIEQAMNAYAKHMQVVCEIEERREAREESEKLHRELQNSLDRIARNQENINNNLEHIRRYK